MTEIRLAPHIVPYNKRKKFCRKVRDAEKKIQKLKDEGDWESASRLGYVLRNVWWGYKRYK
jgi:hypothetical protein